MASGTARALGWLGLSAAALLLGGLTVSDAKPFRDCPSRISPNDPIVTEDWRGIPLSREYYVTSRGVWFKVPFGYLNPWLDRISEPVVRQRAPGRTPQSEVMNTALSYAFWMPSLRWPERNRFNVPSFRPCEDGRPAPGEGEYIVEAELDWPWLPDPEGAGYVLPDDRLVNRLKYRGVQMEDATVEYGLLRLEQKGPRGHVFYHSLPGDPLRVDLDCTGPNTDVPNPSCKGNAWWPEERLGLWLHFSRDDLPDWREIAEAARSLAHRWAVQPVRQSDRP